MATFTYKPAQGASRNISPRVRTAQFGDGYMQRVGDGINTQPRVWDLTFSRKKADIDAIDAFLAARGGVESFDWTPPDGSAQGKFICKTWAKSMPSVRVQTLSGTFEEVFGE